MNLFQHLTKISKLRDPEPSSGSQIGTFYHPSEISVSPKAGFQYLPAPAAQQTGQAGEICNLKWDYHTSSSIVVKRS
jgi:hypothetical protein